MLTGCNSPSPLASWSIHLTHRKSWPSHSLSGRGTWNATKRWSCGCKPLHLFDEIGANCSLNAIFFSFWFSHLFLILLIIQALRCWEMDMSNSKIADMILIVSANEFSDTSFLKHLRNFFCYSLILAFLLFHINLNELSHAPFHISSEGKVTNGNNKQINDIWHFEVKGEMYVVP